MTAFFTCMECPKRKECKEICLPIAKILPKMNTGRKVGSTSILVLSEDLLDRDFYKDNSGYMVSLQDLRKRGIINEKADKRDKI